MYRVMIVDDEKSNRSLLKMTIEWERLGLEFCGEAQGSIEAINTIEVFNPDIMFVDIKMPYMDGIDLSEKIIKEHPKMKIIVLTAMFEFEYARRCVGIGVSDYLTKPIVKEDVNKTLERIIKELDERRPEPEPEDDVLDRLTASGSSMNRICEYIKKNYSNSELNLTYAANTFNFNPSYLSRRFKEETGMSFIDFLTKCRMERALELAANKVQMYLTAKEVGIPDPNYFSKCFKKYTGKSYTEVTKELHGGQ